MTTSVSLRSTMLAAALCAGCASLLYSQSRGDTGLATPASLPTHRIGPLYGPPRSSAVWSSHSAFAQPDEEVHHPWRSVAGLLFGVSALLLASKPLRGAAIAGMVVGGTVLAWGWLSGPTPPILRHIDPNDTATTAVIAGAVAAARQQQASQEAARGTFSVHASVAATGRDFQWQLYAQNTSTRVWFTVSGFGSSGPSAVLSYECTSYFVQGDLCSQLVPGALQVTFTSGTTSYCGLVTGFQFSPQGTVRVRISDVRAYPATCFPGR